MPPFSIVLTSYNQRHLLEPALASVRDQTFEDFEVIAVDDGSTDGSDEFLREEASRDRRIKVFVIANGGSPGRTRNYAIARAVGQYVSFLDADDLYAPTRLEQVQKGFARNPEANMVFGDYTIFTGVPHHSAIGHLSARGIAARLRTIDDVETDCPQRLDRDETIGLAMSEVAPWFTLNAVIHRRALGGSPSTWFDQQLRNGEDFELLTRCAATGGIVYVPCVLGHYRKHTGTITDGPLAPRLRNDAMVHERLLHALGETLHPRHHAPARRRAGQLYFDAAYAFGRVGELQIARQLYWRSLLLSRAPQVAFALVKSWVPLWLRGRIRTMSEGPDLPRVS